MSTTTSYPATRNGQRPSSQSSDTVPWFGALLVMWRERRGLSQTKLSFLCESDHSTLSRIETGSRNPSRIMVGDLADALQIRGHERFTFFASAGFFEVSPDADQLELIECVMALDADELRVVRVMLAGLRGVA